MRMNALETECRRLYDDVLHLLRGEASLRDVVAEMPTVPIWLGGTAQSLPVVKKLSSLPAQTSTKTHAIVQRLVDLAADLPWQQTYTEQQVGKHYLQNYGWFNLLSPEGLFECQSLRISIGVWLKPIFYLEHYHEPEEDYVILAGGGLFRSEGCLDRVCRVGDIVHHVSNQRHSIDMADHDLVALAFWRGGNLMRRATLSGQ
jgi:hypothetical protein